jgi:acyl carrier protein
MNDSDVRKLVLGLLAEIAPEADLTTLPGNADIRDALDIDSMDFLRFVTELHKQVHVDIPEKDYARVRSIDSIVAYLAPKLATQATA